MAESRIPSTEFRRIGSLSQRDLEAMMIHGETPHPERLCGWEYFGLNAGSPARRLSLEKFIKGFQIAPGGGIRGYNLRVWQDGPDAPWRPRPDDEHARPYGFYRVTRVDPAARDNAYPNALLLDYGQGGNGRLNPAGAIRDYLVRVARDSDELLLGRAFLALGPLRLPVGYFVLERFRPRDARG